MDMFLEPHSEPGVTEEEFRDFEAAYGVVLPEDMKEFYRKQNGGFFREGREYFIDDDEYALPLAEFHGLTRTFHPHILTIEHMLKWQRADGFLPRHLVPFAPIRAATPISLRLAAGPTIGSTTFSMRNMMNF